MTFDTSRVFSAVNINTVYLYIPQGLLNLPFINLKH